MLIEHLDPLASSLFSLFAIACLLLSFVMLGSRWLKNYLYAFAAESPGLSPRFRLRSASTAIIRSCT